MRDDHCPFNRSECRHPVRYAQNWIDTSVSVKSAATAKRCGQPRDSRNDVRDYISLLHWQTMTAHG